jgi:acyl-CoA reductase-like NAD-dependent aldehyde dehydrogenase
MRTYERIYIDGQWVASTGTGTIQVFDSTTEEVMATAPQGTAEDVDRAAQAARRAFPAWAALTPHQRGEHLRNVADVLDARHDELLDVMVRETGMAKPIAAVAQVSFAIGSLRTAAEIAENFEYSEMIGHSMVVKEAAGVVGCITPWNYPLRQVTAKIAYAMAAGCTVVLKPTEVAPIDSFMLAEAMHTAGVPAGVFNLVSGYGPVVGEAIASHPEIDMVSFTGSTRAGKRVAELATATVKRVALELGGKGANILLDDLDEAQFARSVAAGVARCYPNSGQTCAALTRMLVPAGRMAEAETAAASAAATHVTGNPFDEGVKLGPLASAAQRDRVRGFIQAGIAEGATLVAGGPDAPVGLEVGYYIQPTVFSNVHPDMTVSREEIFGPVLAIIPYTDEAEAIRIANDTPYGLSAGVQSATQEHALAVARQLHAGQIEINGGKSNPMAPFGGYKQSGNGREYGRYGFEEFLETKSFQLG